MLRVVPTAEGSCSSTRRPSRPPRAGAARRCGCARCTRPHRRGRRLLQRRLGRRAAPGTPPRLRWCDRERHDGDDRRRAPPDDRRPGGGDRGAAPRPARPARRPHRRGCFGCSSPPATAVRAPTSSTAMRLYEDLAAADASVAWIVMIGGGAWCDLVTLPRATFDAVFATGPGRASWPAPSTRPGRSRPVNGGYRVEGRWGFASGCEHADWIFGNCVEGLVDGHPMLRAALFTPDDIVIEDTWTATGMCATASHHFRVDGLSVPPIGPSCRSRASPASTSPSPASTRPRSSHSWSPAWPSASPAAPSSDVFALAGGKVPMLAAVAAGDEPAVPARGRGRRHGAAGVAQPAARDRRGDLGRGSRRSRTCPSSDRARARAAAAWATERRHPRRRHRPPLRRRDGGLRRLAPPTPAPRHPHPHPALHRPPRHPHHGRRGAPRTRTGRPGVLGRRQEAPSELLESPGARRGT